MQYVKIETKSGGGIQYGTSPWLNERIIHLVRISDIAEANAAYGHQALCGVWPEVVWGTEEKDGPERQRLCVRCEVIRENAEVAR